MKLNIQPGRWFNPRVVNPGQFFSEMGQSLQRLAGRGRSQTLKADVYLPSTAVTASGAVAHGSESASAAKSVFKPYGLLPPATAWPIKSPPNPVVTRGWERHAEALRHLKPVQEAIARPYRRAIGRHNDAVIKMRESLNEAANGDVGRALGRDLHRMAVAVHQPVALADRLVARPLDAAARIATGNPISKVATGFAVGLVVSHNPAASTAAVLGSGLAVGGLKVIKKTYQAVYDDGNSVRRWINRFGDRLPTF